VLRNLGNLTEGFRARIEKVLPAVLDRLALPAFHVGKMELQMTAANDGDALRFRGALPNAELTFLLMFYREPKRFTGGELRVYDARLKGGRWTPANSFRAIPVEQNRLVVFPSRFAHEFLTVHCGSHAFVDSLFTMTGWLYKA
jgi:Rps23 Pro-64 3,4-dihydroxylase Tpa1-like proline 4-hydroxylase